MNDLSHGVNSRSRKSAVRMLVIFTVVFFMSLVVGTVFGGIFIRDALRAERQEQVEQHLHGFEAALKTVLKQIDNFGQTAAYSLSDLGQSDPGKLTATINTFIAATPWLKAVVIHNEIGTWIEPSDFFSSINAMNLLDSQSAQLGVLGPYQLQDGTHVLVYRFVENGNVLDLAVSFEEILKAVGFLELENSARFAVETNSSITGPLSIAVGEDIAELDDVGQTEVTSDNSKWTISIEPKSLESGVFDWSLTIKVMTALLLCAFTVPFIGLIFLLRKRARDAEQLHYKTIDVENLSQQLSVALKASKIGLWQHDLETGVQIWDDQIIQIYGVKSGSHQQSFESWLSYLHPDDRARFKRFNWKDAEKSNGFISEYRVITPDGREKNIRSAGNAFIDANGQQKFVGVNWDISEDTNLKNALADAKATAESKNAELENARLSLQQLAHQDALTEVANRRHFEQKLDAMQVCGTLPLGTKIIIIDLDGFKSINDTMGHFFGDEVLRYAANAFSQHLGPNDFLARTGGDEFVILMPPESDSERLAQNILNEFSGARKIAGRFCRVGASVGVAIAEIDNETAGDLLIKADIALYEAKKHGRGRTALYTEDLKEKAFTQKKLGDDLQEALENDQITAFFQPIIDLQTMKMIGVEALARWQHPIRGLLEPHQFLDTAAQLGLLKSIDEIVFIKAMTLLNRYTADGAAGPSMSVNISAERLQDPVLLGQIAAYDLEPGSLHFELLESISFEQADSNLLKTIRDIRKMGICVDIDDFGSGYASLLGLMNVRPDRLKIAREIVAPAVTSPENALVIQTIIGIANSLEIDVICEGINSEEHARFIRNLGCNKGQGYFLSRPMDANQFLQYLSAKR